MRKQAKEAKKVIDEDDFGEGETEDTQLVKMEVTHPTFLKTTPSETVEETLGFKSPYEAK